MDMIRKFVVAAAATAVAVSCLPSSSLAKKSHKEPLCSFGQACTDKPAKISQITGWVTVKRCSYEGKMYQDVFPCYGPSGACPAATCKAKK